jgi:hypothetical protein
MSDLHCLQVLLHTTRRQCLGSYIWHMEGAQDRNVVGGCRALGLG